MLLNLRILPSSVYFLISLISEFIVSIVYSLYYPLIVLLLSTLINPRNSPSRRISFCLLSFSLTYLSSLLNLFSIFYYLISKIPIILVNPHHYLSIFSKYIVLFYLSSLHILITYHLSSQNSKLSKKLLL